MRSENVERAELWILAARPPPRLEIIEQVESAELLVRRGTAAEDDMLIIWLLHGLNCAPPECLGRVRWFVVSLTWWRGRSRSSGLFSITLFCRKKGEVNQPRFVGLRFHLRM